MIISQNVFLVKHCFLDLCNRKGGKLSPYFTSLISSSLHQLNSSSVKCKTFLQKEEKKKRERHEVSSFMEVIKVVFLSILPYSHSLAFIPRVKLDTQGFVMGL